MQALAGRSKRSIQTKWHKLKKDGRVTAYLAEANTARKKAEMARIAAIDTALRLETVSPAHADLVHELRHRMRQSREQEQIRPSSSRVLLQFHTDVRPAFFRCYISPFTPPSSSIPIHGQCRRPRSAVVRGRRFLAKDPRKNYEVDSDEEWELPQDSQELVSEDEDGDGFSDSPGESEALMSDDELIDDGDNGSDMRESARSATRLRLDAQLGRVRGRRLELHVFAQLPGATSATYSADEVSQILPGAKVAMPMCSLLDPKALQHTRESFANAGGAMSAPAWGVQSAKMALVTREREARAEKKRKELLLARRLRTEAATRKRAAAKVLKAQRRKNFRVSVVTTVLKQLVDRVEQADKIAVKRAVRETREAERQQEKQRRAVEKERNRAARAAAEQKQRLEKERIRQERKRQSMERRIRKVVSACIDAMVKRLERTKRERERRHRIENAPPAKRARASKPPPPAKPLAPAPAPPSRFSRGDRVCALYFCSSLGQTEGSSEQACISLPAWNPAVVLWKMGENGPGASKCRLRFYTGREASNLDDSHIAYRDNVKLVWAKQKGMKSWWPAQELPPRFAPEPIRESPLAKTSSLVCFLGGKNVAWGWAAKEMIKPWQPASPNGAKVPTTKSYVDGVALATMLATAMLQTVEVSSADGPQYSIIDEPSNNSIPSAPTTVRVKIRRFDE